MVNKTITFIKQYFFMLALAVTFVGFSAFKVAERNLDTQWYTITFNDPEDPNQDQLGTDTEDPTEGGDCALEPNEIRCAVQLNNPNNHDLSNMSVEDALSLSGVSIQDYTYRAE